MVDIIEKHDGPLAGWVIGVWCTAWVIGKPDLFDGLIDESAIRDGSVVTLKPAYEIALGTQLQPPKVNIIRACFPIKSFPSIREIHGVQVAILVEHLTREERKTLEQAVLQCDELLRQLRANDAGIAVARPGAPDLARLKHLAGGRH